MIRYLREATMVKHLANTTNRSWRIKSAMTTLLCIDAFGRV